MAKSQAKAISGEQVIESDTAQLQALLDTIVQVAHPVQVILFGSRAKRRGGPESDYDFLVVVRTTDNERQLSGLIYQALLTRRLGVAADIIVVSADTLYKNKDNPFFVYRSALSEGRILYGPPSVGWNSGYGVQRVIYAWLVQAKWKVFSWKTSAFRHNRQRRKPSKQS